MVASAEPLAKLVELARLLLGNDVEYRVELDIYNGPLDLLLYLIKRDELDIYDIPISRITDSYLGFLQQPRAPPQEHGLDINVARDLPVKAASPKENKAALLLPQPPPRPRL